MKVFTLRRQQLLPISVERAWTFFSSAGNLAKITPPEMGFSIVSTLDEAPVYSGMLIEYRVKPLLGISIKWVTEIVGVDAPNMFTDRQLKGPYTLWEHTHRFRIVKGGVEMTDEVKYALPLGFLGTIAHALVVKNKLKKIFDFRTEALRNLFGEINVPQYEDK